MAKTKPEKPETEGAAEAPAKPRRGRIVVALAAVLTASSAAGGYFAFQTAFAGTPSEEAAGHGEPAAIPFPMPAAVMALAPATTAQDYQIVSIFGGEAIVATPDNLLRLTVGSQAPGLGTITAVEPADNGGGSVVGTLATLRSL